MTHRRRRQHCRELGGIQERAVWRFWVRRLFWRNDPLADAWDAVVVQTVDAIHTAMGAEP